MAIPKILHYCWFGNAAMPRTEKRCTSRWQNYFNDYETKCWTEDNFDIQYNQYVEEAYKMRKFAYVADVARLKALYDFGGIYLDADCRVRKKFDDLLECHAFTGFGGDNKEIAACTLGFEPQDPYIKECLDSYTGDHFINPNGSLNTESVNQRMTKILIKYGFKTNGEKQVVRGIIIYPMSYFCPLSMLPDEVKDCKGKDTYSMALWTSPELRRERNWIIRLAHKTGLNEFLREIKKI